METILRRISPYPHDHPIIIVRPYLSFISVCTQSYVKLAQPPWAERSRLFLCVPLFESSGLTQMLSHTHTHKLPPCCLKESSSTPLVTDFDEHVIKVTQCKAMEVCVIDLLAHYDAVAELMAAMGGWLENRAGSFNGLAVSYGRKFTNEKVEGKCGCVYVCVCERQRGNRVVATLLPSLSCAEGEM